MSARLWLSTSGMVAVLLGCAASAQPVGTGGGGGAVTSAGGAGGATSTGTAGGATSTGTGGQENDPCKTAKCDKNAACADIDGGASCLCLPGWLGDGMTCADIDECAMGTAMCDAHAFCANTPGSYTCTCNPGFTGDGKTCTDIDECAAGTTMCGPDTTCQNIPGGYKCLCPTGYANAGLDCVDIDECKNGSAKCDTNAACTNTPGSFTCACKAGYTGDGKTCTDIDECANGTSACDPNATCTNTVGWYTCACNASYVGSGTTCTPVSMGVPGEVSINGGDAATSSTAVTLYLQEPQNLLQNPGAEAGSLSGWTIKQNGGEGWSAASGNPPVHLFGQLAFGTSYELDTRSQLLDLTTLGYTQGQLDAGPPITVREWYTGVGSDPADSYYIKIELRDGNNNVLASLNDSATMSTTKDAWQMAAKTFTGYGTGLRYVYFEDGGQDSEFSFSSNAGAAMDGASVVVGAVQMRISNDNTNWTAWQPFTAVLPWTLDATSGVKTVYVQYQDANNQMWPSVSNSITLH